MISVSHLHPGKALAKDATAMGVSSQDVDEGLRAVATALLDEAGIFRRNPL